MAVVFENPALPHQIVIGMAPGGKLMVSCNCLRTGHGNGIRDAYEPIEIRSCFPASEAIAAWRAHLEWSSDDREMPVGRARLRAVFHSPDPHSAAPVEDGAAPVPLLAGGAAGPDETGNRTEEERGSGAVSNGNSFGNSDLEPWYFRLMRPIRDRQDG
jgi:hypothetical protein